MFFFQWQRSDRSLAYVWYRWIVAVFYTFSFVNSVISSIMINEASVMFIFLSRWNLLGSAVATLLGAYLASCYYYDRDKMATRGTFPIKFYWFISNNSVVTAFVVSTVYWTLLSHEGPKDLNNFLMHTTNSIGLLIDVFIVRHPHRVSHLVYPMACGASYMLFTIIYTFFGGVDHEGRNFVYPILDWKTTRRKR